MERQARTAGTLGHALVGRRMLDGLVEANEVLTIAIGNDGRIELN